MDQAIIRETDDRAYFTMLPNIVDDADLDPHEFRLLCHYYRVGETYESNKTTAKKCGMSVRTVQSKRQSLADKGWVELEWTVPTDHTKGQVIVIVIDKWADNVAKYGKGGAGDAWGAGDASKEELNIYTNKKEKRDIYKYISPQKEKKPIKKQPPDSKEWQELLSLWCKKFPRKPQPRKSNNTLRGKFSTRMKSKHFRENWQEALTIGAGSEFLHESNWFDLHWFLKNDDNYEKCLNGKYGGGVQERLVVSDR